MYHQKGHLVFVPFAASGNDNIEEHHLHKLSVWVGLKVNSGGSSSK